MCMPMVYACMINAWQGRDAAERTHALLRMCRPSLSEISQRAAADGAYGVGVGEATAQVAATGDGDGEAEAADAETVGMALLRA